MRFLRLYLILPAAAWLMTPGYGLSQTTPPEAAADDVMPTLKMLHDRGDTLHDFTANVAKFDYHKQLDDSETRTGSVAYQKTNGVTKLAIDFKMLKSPDMADRKLDELDGFDGRNFIRRDNIAKTYELHELVPAGQHYDPLKLDNNSVLPLPIGQDPAEILRQFTVTLETPSAGLPAGYKAEDLTVLKLVPKINGKYAFKSAELFIDPKIQIPVRIKTVAPDKDESTITLSDLKINRGTPAALDIAEPPANQGWTVTREPYKEGPTKLGANHDGE